jgi:tetratricopeptide (TPR) repeat protein
VLVGACGFALCVGTVAAQQDEGPVLKPKSKPKPSSATILVVCDLDCTWRLDGEAMGNLAAGSSKKVAVSLGQHLLDAFIMYGPDKAEREIEIKTATQTIVRLELQPIRDARLKSEQATREKAAQEQAARDQIAREQTAREQATREQSARDQAPREQASPQDNSLIPNLNASLAKARQDNSIKNFTEADSLMTQATQAKPDASVLWLELGIAQTGEKKYDDAIVSLKKALGLDTSSNRPNPAIEAAADNALGEVYASTNRIPESTASYDAAAMLQPANAAMFYTNETIVLSRAGRADTTIAAADKAIAANPNNPIPYYLKGQALISKATVDRNTQKIVAPPGTGEAYKNYLRLAPNGPMAPEARSMLAEIGDR